IVDKCDRRCMIVGIDLIQGLIMLAVGVLAYINALSVPIVLLAALCTAFGSVFYSPAISTIMLDIIPRDDLVRGQSIHSGISSLIDLVGSAISGAMVAFFGVPLIVVINGLSNLYSAVTELFVRVPKTVQQGNTVTVKGVMRDLRCAAGEIISDKCLKIFVPCALILNLLGAGPLTLMLPFCLEKGFTVDMYGYLISIFSAAYVAGALVLGAVKLRPSARYLVMSFGFTLYVPCFVVACFAGRYVVLCIFAFLAGLFNCAGNTVFNAALMLALPNENRSAILGFIRSASVGGTALSAVIYGFIGELFPLYIIFALGSAISLIPMIYLCFNKNTRDFMIKHSSAEI
ncbi:MAG: MFS transporter, partial [Clostridia bacterium]|nr:MFS transporter [Clostridia bacterium]